MTTGARTRVLVVDDSAIVRKLIADALRREPDIEVVGGAADPFMAREMIQRFEPDVLTLDIEMPRMDGLTFLRKLMAHRPLPVIIVSSVTQTGSAASIEALRAGAIDVIAKPGGPQEVGQVATRIVQRIRGLRQGFSLRPVALAPGPAAARAAAVAALAALASGRRGNGLLGVGASPDAPSRPAADTPSGGVNVPDDEATTVLRRVPGSEPVPTTRRAAREAAARRSR